MLFDLRGRGRRRTVQVIYLGLALLFGVGFIGFGAGGGFGSGGVLNFLGENKEGGNATFGKQVSAAQKRITRHPKEPAAWAALTEAQLHQASEGQYYDQETEKYTDKGKELLSKVARSWSTYLSLEQHNPSTALAKQMFGRVFSEIGLNQPSQAVQSLEIIVEAEPTNWSWYTQLAAFAYKANNPREGDLASGKAVSLAPASERKTLKQKLEEVKKNPSGLTGGSTAATGGATPGG